MRIGIVVFSQTGHTKGVAASCQKALEQKGHQVDLMEIQVAPTKSRNQVTLLNSPLVEGYDALAFGSPVHGFSLSMEMKSYLTNLPMLRGKKAVCFVTQGLAGGKRSNKTMVTLCQAKGISVADTGVVTWPRKKSRVETEQLVERLTGSLLK